MLITPPINQPISTPGAADITVHISGMRLSLENATPDDIRALGCITHKAVCDNGSCRIVKQLNPFVDCIPFQSTSNAAKHRPCTSAGLTEVVERLAATSGRTSRLLNYTGRPVPLPAPQCEKLPTGYRHDREVLDFVQQHDLGIVKYHAGVDRYWLLTQIALAYPEATIAIATATYQEARRIHERLELLKVSSTLVTARHCPQEPGRVVVGTYTAMGHNPVESGKRDIFICVNAAHALGELAQMCLLQADFRCRLFGFLPASRRLAPSERDRLMATFGPHEFTVPAHGHRAVTPRVVWVKFRHRATPDTGNGSTAQLKRKLLWVNRIRNRRIARMAKLLCTGDHTELAQQFPAVSEAVGGREISHITVLVDGLEHAIGVADRLPGWPITCGADASTDGLSQRQRSILERARSWSMGYEILTAAAADHYAFRPTRGLTVIIWASSGTGLPPVPAAWQTAPTGESAEILLVDFDDRGQPTLAKWTQQRKRAYREAEWLAPGVDPVAARIDRFLQTRQVRRQP